MDGGGASAGAGCMQALCPTSYLFLSDGVAIKPTRRFGYFRRDGPSICSFMTPASRFKDGFWSKQYMSMTTGYKYIFGHALEKGSLKKKPEIGICPIDFLPHLAF